MSEPRRSLKPSTLDALSLVLVLLLGLILGFWAGLEFRGCGSSRPTLRGRR